MEEKKNEEIVEKNEESVELTEEVKTEESKVEDAGETDEKKSGRYETLKELEPNLWTYGSPILLTSGVLQRDLVSQKNRLTLKFVNIYEQDIRDVHLSILVEDEEEPEVIEHSYLALGQKYLAEKGRAAQITVPNEEARDFQIVIDQIVFEDGSTWHKKDAVLESAGEMDDIETFAQAKLKDYEDNYLTASEEIAKDESENIGNGIEILKRIRWYKDGNELYKDAKRKYGILKQNEERKMAGASKKADREQAMKKRTIEVVVAIGIIIAIAIVVVVAYIIPNNKFKSAKKTYESGKYKVASEQFEKLNGFKDSESYLSASYYNMAKQYYENGDTKSAKDYFKKSYDADKDCDEGQQAKAFLDYYDGVESMESGDYKKAQELLQSSKESIGDYNLVNDIDTRLSELYYLQEDYESAWNSIINIYAKNTDNEEISTMYCTYGEAYAKKLIADGKRKEGMEVYGKVKDNKYYKGSVLTKKFYDEAVKLAEKGKIDDALKILKDIKDQSPKANKLYKHINKFNDTVQYWTGVWRHKTKVGGKKKVYYIKISKVFYKGQMCLKIKDKNNKKLGFETVISSKNRVTQISIGQYILKFKLKKYSDQKFTYTLKEGGKMERKLKYSGNTYTSNYKRIKKLK